jgi:branched-chain amino acid transport system substrate-binding protein
VEIQSRRFCRGLRFAGAGMALALGIAIGAGTAAAQAPGVSNTEILLGGVFALSGPVRFVTQPYEQGARSVIDDVNEHGGINGRKLVWHIEDDGYQPARTLAGAKKLVERDEVFALFGQIGTPTTLAIIPYVDQAKVPFLPANAAPDPAPKYAFGLMANYADIAYLVGRHMITKMGLKKIGLLYQNDDTGESGRIGLMRALKDAGMSLAADVPYERGTNDFETEVLKLRDGGVDAVVAMGTGPAIATQIKQADALGVHPVWGTYGVGGSLLMQKLLGSEVDGLVFASEVDNQYSDAPGTQQAVATIHKHVPEAPVDFLSLLGYADARILVHALELSGPDLTREKLVASLNSMSDFDTGVMPVSFSPTNHTAAKSAKIFRWKSGKPQPESNWLPLPKLGN